MIPDSDIPKLADLLMRADSLICVLDNLTRGYRPHQPEDKDCWCNGCVNPRAIIWQEQFREICYHSDKTSAPDETPKTVSTHPQPNPSDKPSAEPYSASPPTHS